MVTRPGLMIRTKPFLYIDQRLEINFNRRALDLMRGWVLVDIYYIGNSTWILTRGTRFKLGNRGRLTNSSLTGFLISRTIANEPMTHAELREIDFNTYHLIGRY